MHDIDIFGDEFAFIAFKLHKINFNAIIKFLNWWKKNFFNMLHDYYELIYYLLVNFLTSAEVELVETEREKKNQKKE